MANDGFALNYATPHDAARSITGEVVFVALLLLFFVGLTPFAPPPAPTMVGPSMPAPGDALRQILYLSIFFPILFAAFLHRGFNIVRAVPLALVLMLVWCFASIFWSAAPDITFRRAALAAIVIVSTMLSVELIGTTRAFLLWRIVLALILLVNWLSIPLVHTAVHLPGEVDPGLIGDWRGLYAQKNTTGAVCAMTAILFLFTRNGRGNWLGWLVAAAATAFLVMTKSKTSLGLLPMAVMAGFFYRISWRDNLSRAIFLCAAILVVGFAATFAVLNWDAIDRLLSDPTGFTGRAEIWQTSLAFLRDHPLLGAGFGTVAHTGMLSPLHNYARNGWVEAIADSHDGYLQIWVATGGIGLGIALAAMVLDPILRFWRLEPGRVEFRALLFALFIFMLLHNFMETDFLESDDSGWFAFLVVLASLKIRDKSLTGHL